MPKYLITGSYNAEGVKGLMASTLAASGTISSSGKVSAKLTPLITTEEMDAAAAKSKSSKWRAPGA